MARRISFQRQIMEAGFGEMLLDHGFSKQSATHYRRHRGRVIWDQVLIPHTVSKPEPRCFRDVLGATYVGFEDLFADFLARLQALGEDSEAFLVKIPGTKLISHDQRHTLVAYAERDPEPLAYYPPPRPKGLWNRLFWTPPKPAMFVHRHPDAVYGHSYNYWHIRDEREIADFVQEFCDFWQKSVLEEIRLDETSGSFCRDRYKKIENSIISPFEIILLCLDGYYELALEKAEATIPELDEDHDSLFKFFEENGTFEEPHFQDPKRRKSLVERSMAACHYQGTTALALKQMIEARR